MTPERWLEIERLYHAALKRESDRRRSFLAEACGGDENLREQVTRLLAQSGSTRDLADLPGLWQSLANDTGAGTTLEPGARLGPYQIVGPLGEGGMGKVYRALDTRLGRAVAVKISAEQFSQRFEREARAISTLNHPNICTLYDIGSLPSGAGYMVTELVEGETLRDWLKHSPAAFAPARWARSLGTVRQIVEALRAAHQAGLVHRDLKPANIMVRSDGYVKVLDFGLAKRIAGANSDKTGGGTMTALSTPGEIVGTVAYMSPEQILGQEADARSDVFALGIILYEMAAGRHPWPRPSAVDTMHAILHDDPPPLDAPAGALEPVIGRCLSKPPHLRFGTMAELEASLSKIAPEPASIPAANKPSIAILPFANMSGDKENEYFGDGLAEEVINMLAQLSGIKVAARTSSFFFRGKDIEFAEIGKRLSVEHILEGSVRKAGNRLRVTAQLIKVADGFHLWSERYDREMTDIFAIQDEITQSIAAALRIRLSPETARPCRHQPNLRAYEAYLKAREVWFRPAPGSLLRVKELLELAIHLDPQFALAHSLLGVHYTGQASLRPAREVIPLAHAAEEAALSIDPTLPEAHAILGCCDGYEYDWSNAERHWRLALAVESVPRDVHFWHANHYLLPIGRLADAVKAEAAVLDEDPLNLLYRWLYAIALQHAGRLSDAEMELRKVLEIDANSQNALGTLGLICAQRARFEEALALTERAHAITPQFPPLTGQLAELLLRAGHTSRADSLIWDLRSGGAYGATTGLAVFHALRGEFDQAAEWAEQAIEERHPRLVAVLRPLLGSMPQWLAVAKRMNLPG